MIFGQGEAEGQGQGGRQSEKRRGVVRGAIGGQGDHQSHRRGVQEPEHDEEQDGAGAVPGDRHPADGPGQPEGEAPLRGRL